MYWLLEQETLSRFEAMARRMDPAAFLVLRREPSTPKSILAVSGDVATIKIRGVLTPEADPFAELFGNGNTSYQAIRQALRDADEDEKVKSIELDIDSPGGTVAGMFETADAIKKSKKPVRAIIGSLGASAAYALASQAGVIQASSRASWIGSVGVVRSFMVWPEDVDITSTDAPKKWPDVTTDEGKAAVREELDEIHLMLAEDIAAGRKTTVANVNKNFGRGGMMLAAAAKNAGMIDEIGDSIGATGLGSTRLENEMEDSGMPDKTYEEGLAAGRAQEKARVIGHLGLAEKSGAMDLALAAIKGDNAVDAAAFEAHMEAKTKDKELQAREGEDKSVAPAANAAAPAPAGTDGREARVAAETARLMGFDLQEVN